MLNAVWGVPYKTELVDVCRIYKDDINPDDLRIELPMFICQIPSEEQKNYTVAKLFELLKNMPQALKSLQHEVVIYAKLMIVMPATIAES